MNGQRVKVEGSRLKVRRAAVVAPGPSGRLYPGADDGGHEFVVGVNRAVLWTEADYWSCADAHTFGWVADEAGPILFPTIVCPDAIYEAMGWRATLYAHLRPSMDWLPGAHGPWRAFSAHVAIVLAAHLGATEIDCYGMDMVGTADADGFTDGRQRRDDGRWAKEAARLADLTSVLAGRGVRVNRIGTQPERLCHQTRETVSG